MLPPGRWQEILLQISVARWQEVHEERTVIDTSTTHLLSFARFESQFHTTHLLPRSEQNYAHNTAHPVSYSEQNDQYGTAERGTRDA